MQLYVSWTDIRVFLPWEQVCAKSDGEEVKTGRRGMPGYRHVRAVILGCACVCVGAIEHGDVMAALPAEMRELLRKQNAEVTSMTDTICALAP